MKKNLFSIFLAMAVVGCGGSQPTENNESQKTYTEVTVTHVESGHIKQSIELRAESSYLHTIQVTAPVTGFVKAITIQPGQEVHRGQWLFSMVSAEQQALGMNVKPLTVNASRASMVTEVVPQTGSYLTEGSAVCTLVDLSSFVFQVKVPAEYGQTIHQGMPCTIELPDGTRLTAQLSKPLLTMDGTDQTINYVARVKTHPLPAGLVAKAFVKPNDGERGAQQILPKEAVQSDDNLTSFWVMKLTSDSTVQRIPVTIGRHDSHQTEIKSPVLSPNDRIVLTGAYGLADDALVKLKK